MSVFNDVITRPTAMKIASASADSCVSGCKQNTKDMLVNFGCGLACLLNSAKPAGKHPTVIEQLHLFFFLKTCDSTFAYLDFL